MAWFRVHLSEEQQRVVNEERVAHPDPRPREDARPLVAALRGQAKKRPRSSASVGPPSTGTSPPFAGGPAVCRSCNHHRPQSEMAAYRDLIRESSEATGPHRGRGVRPHLPTDRVAGAAPAKCKFLKDLGQKFRAFA